MKSLLVKMLNIELNDKESRRNEGIIAAMMPGL